MLSIHLSAVSTRALCSISLCFPHYNLVHAELLNKLLVALVLIQCENLTITTSPRGKHHIDVIMPPGYTPMVWNLTNLMIEGNLDYTPFQPLLFGASVLLKELTLCFFQATFTSFVTNNMSLLFFSDICLPYAFYFYLSKHKFTCRNT
jgi:hypothetical protein